MTPLKLDITESIFLLIGFAMIGVIIGVAL